MGPMNDSSSNNTPIYRYRRSKSLKSSKFVMCVSHDAHLMMVNDADQHAVMAVSACPTSFFTYL